MFNYSKEFHKKTIAAWQPFSFSILSENDAREIAENTVGLFTLLSEWEDEDVQENKKMGEEK